MLPGQQPESFTNVYKTMKRPTRRMQRSHLLWCSVLCIAWAAALPSTTYCQNLVPNPGFEETDTCFFGIGYLPPGAGPNYWYRAYITFDHLQSCLPYGSVNGLPMNFFTFQEPFEGNACIGLFTYFQNGVQEQREWVMVPLVEPMVVGQTYYCSFRANAAFGGNAQYPTDLVGQQQRGHAFHHL